MKTLLINCLAFVITGIASLIVGCPVSIEITWG